MNNRLVYSLMVVLLAVLGLWIARGGFGAWQEGLEPGVAGGEAGAAQAQLHALRETTPVARPVDRRSVASEDARSGPGTGSISGVVVDALGEPVEGLPVFAWSDYYPAAEGDELVDLPAEGAGRHQVRTDASGAYRFEALPCGPILVLPGDCTPSGHGVSARGELVDELRFDFELIGYLEYSGRVLTAVPDDVVIRLQSVSPPFGMLWSDEAGSQPAAADGRFRFLGLLPGHYEVVVRSRHHERFASQFHLTRSVRDVQLPLDRVPGFSVAGRVEWDGATADDWAWVALRGKGGYARGGPTSPGLRFLFEGAPVGEYELEVSRKLQGGRMPTWLERRFRLDLDAAIEDLRVSMEAGDCAWLAVSVPDEVEEAEGVVRLDGVDPLAELREYPLRLRRDGSEMRAQRKETSGWTRWVDEPKYFRLTDVTPGRYRLLVELDGFAPFETETILEDGSLISVALERRVGRVVRFCEEPRPREWHRRVEYRAAGSSDAWEPLLWHDRTLDLSSTLREDGLLRAFLPPGTYDFRWSDSASVGYVERDFELRDDPYPLELCYQPDPGVRVTGHVLTPAGKPLPSSIGGSVVTLYVARRDAGVWHPLPEKMVLHHSGGFVIRGLAPGDYRIGLTPRVEEPLAEFEVSGADLELVLTLPR